MSCICKEIHDKAKASEGLSSLHENFKKRLTYLENFTHHIEHFYEDHVQNFSSVRISRSGYILSFVKDM